MNHRHVLLVLAVQAALPVANKINRELHARRVDKSQSRIRSIWNSDGEKDAYALDRKAYEKYLDDICSFYETPQTARRELSQNLAFNNIIRHL